MCCEVVEVGVDLGQASENDPQAGGAKARKAGNVVDGWRPRRGHATRGLALGRQNGVDANPIGACARLALGHMERP